MFETICFLAACATAAGAVSFVPAESVSGEESPDAISELIARIAAAGPEERPALVHRLSRVGPEALSATRAARDAQPEGELRRAYGRAATWQLAQKIAPTLLEGFESRLTFAGQFLSLESEGPEVAEALFSILDDEASDARIRLAACRALADVLDPKLEHARSGGLLSEAERSSFRERLRRVHRDVLLPQAIKEQVGFLLALLGDLQAVDASLRRLLRLSASADELERAQSHLELADLYYRIRQYDKAVKNYEKLTEFFEVLLSAQKRAPGNEETTREIARQLALHYYNAACSSALGGDIDRAKLFLKRAVELDSLHLESIQKDGDLSNLRRDPGYPEFFEALKKLAK